MYYRRVTFGFPNIPLGFVLKKFAEICFMELI